MDRAKIEEGVRLILEGVGEDPGREGLPGAQHPVLTFHQLVQLLKLAHVLHLPFMLILYAKLARK